MRRSDFNQFLPLRTQLVVTAIFLAENKVRSITEYNNFQKLEKPLKFFHKVVDVVDMPKRKICMTLMRYNVD